MTRQELFALCGSMEQEAYVRTVQYLDGRASGLRCAEVKNGPLQFSLMLDKCLDPACITYRGINLSFLSRPGLQGRGPSDATGAEGIRSIMGGAMFTCGLDHIHGFCSIDGKEYPTHGRIRNTPAEKIGTDAWFEEGEYRIQVKGEMRQASLFGENLVLRRRVETVYGSRTIRFIDEITNESSRPEPFCFLYHCNAGYPLLMPGTRLLLPVLRTVPRDEAARNGLPSGWVMEEPEPECEEEVYLHVPAADEGGNTFGAFINDELKLALSIRWNVAQIPLVTQWKSRAAGDYAMALEPCNAGFEGRAGKLPLLKPFETHRNEWSFSVLEGRDELEELEKEYERLALHEKDSA